SCLTFCVPGEKGTYLLDWLKNVFAHHWTQCLWDNDGAISLLVIFQNCNQPTCRSQGAIERRSDLGLAVFIAVASLQTTRLESGAIRGRSELAVSTLRWNRSEEHTSELQSRFDL